MFQARQAGFTLVELMVAMAIGTVIILGAGQLFLTTFHTFDKVKELSRKQETVVFATTALVNEYRKTERKDNYSLAETTGNPDECSIRALASDSGNASHPRPIVGGLAPFAEGSETPVCDSGRFMEMINLDDAVGSYRRFTLDFKRDDEEETIESISFHVMERKF
ncbi:prepilin-type N-terminal cleavage/methylation domain-containing protein [Halomonas sp. KX33721]|jgi:prepilin-type N-terminal cleavage/methylation domain-containing protein|uniref:PilW family protein n=1 Tax=Halomonas sp. KX33721 TaxID=1819251 RepID=UPI00078050ED|nr:prepilin-type N-terminal cleavage/methylation domain-containing protein [Halomonas sp. KX33721]